MIPIQLLNDIMAKRDEQHGYGEPTRTAKCDINSHQYEYAPEPMVVEHAIVGRTLRKKKEKVPNHLKRGATEKKMDNFTKNVLMISLDKPFDEAYFTHILWMFSEKPRKLRGCSIKSERK
ncbi:hypothetical protein F2Q68_00004849 [Brassica cretica]|uniref:Uncharacterized protein n=1 Tax=Brassica cretica TaxID=69181 RepID=A0A8S9J7P0_BRACR|nr:hypothetical protein F2Q68_00004849 [Brassica cretica]